MRAYSTKPMPANTTASATAIAQAAQQQLARPVARRAAARTAARTGRRRTPRFSAALRAIGRVERLQRVQRDATPAAAIPRAARSGLPRRRGRALSARPREQPRQQVRERAGRDHQVQRDQQVDGAAVGGDRQPERQRQHGEQRERVGAAAHQHDQRRRSRPPRRSSAGREHAGGRRASPASASDAHGRTSVKLRGESTVRRCVAQVDAARGIRPPAPARRRSPASDRGRPSRSRRRA